MRNKIINFVLFFAILSFCLRGGITLNKIDEWKSDYLLKGMYRGSFVNDKGELIIMLKKHGILRMKDGDIKIISKEGQGPGEILFEASLCKLEKGFADVEYHRKIQIFYFDNKANKYRWKKNLWREEKGCTQFIESSLFYKNKWFFGGGVFRNVQAKETKEDIISPFFLKVFDDQGKLIKNMVKLKFGKMIRSYLFNSFLESNDDKIYFVVENKMRIFVIDGDRLILKEIINLREPKCYKKLPEKNYYFGRRRGDRRNMRSLYEEWKTNYSLIVNFKIIPEYFVFEIRNFGDDCKKKFALLFYNKKNRKLEKTIYTNDFLLAKKGMYLYFLKGGIPRIDDEAETLTIVLYKVSWR